MQIGYTPTSTGQHFSRRVRQVLDQTHK